MSRGALQPPTLSRCSTSTYSSRLITVSLRSPKSRLQSSPPPCPPMTRLSLLVFAGLLLLMSFFALSLLSVFSARKRLAKSTASGEEESLPEADALSSLEGRIHYPRLLHEPKDDVYPVYTSLLTILERWHPDDPDPPQEFHETLQHFNYSNPYERAMAELFRDKEVPFKLYDIPDVDAVTNKWTNRYLLSKTKAIHPHVEKSETNHFMFWNALTVKRMRESYTPPTEVIFMEFADWLKIALEGDRDKISKNSPHYYFMLNSMASRFGRTFLSDDIPAFSTNKNNFFVTNVYKNKGAIRLRAVVGVILYQVSSVDLECGE